MKVKTLAFAIVLLMSETASAQESPAPAPRATSGMGAQGQIVLAADLPFMNSNPLFAVIRQSNSAANGSPSTSATIYAIAPSADYFVAPNVSLGGLIGIAHGSTSTAGSSNDTTTFGIMVRGGYSAQLTESLSLWARLGIGYSHTSTTSGGFDITLSTVPLVVEVPILWHPAPHFFIGAGPTLTTELSSSASAMGNSQDQSKTTDIGVTTMLGGYFGGT